MNSIEFGKGYCLAFGGTNARTAYLYSGELTKYHSENTPHLTDDFFRWMAERVLKASDSGAEWAVAGFPGPVLSDGDRLLIGPMANVPGLSQNTYDLKDMLGKADPACIGLFNEGFRIEPVNDGDLAGQAAATLVETNNQGKFDTVGSLIIGTGVGAAIVKRDSKLQDVFRPSGMPVEVGHIMEGNEPEQTLENHYSGPALSKKHGYSLEDLAASHVAWREVAAGVGKCATLLSLFAGAEVVVPSGGVASNGFGKYQGYLSEFMQQYAKRGNGAQRKFIPEIIRIPEKDIETYELTGAEGHMRHLTTS